MAVAVAVAVSGGGAVAVAVAVSGCGAVAVAVAGLTKDFFVETNFGKFFGFSLFWADFRLNFEFLTSPAASTSNFASDTPFLRSVRPKIGSVGSVFHSVRSILRPKVVVDRPGYIQRTVPPVADENGKTKSETHAFLMNFGRTDLLIGQSKAKNCKESAGDVRIGVAPQKPSQNIEKHEKFRDNKFFEFERQNVGNRPKRVFAKFRCERS